MCVGIRSAYRLELRRRITLIINAIFTMTPELSYYQGFHEICSVLMLNINDDAIAFGLASILGSAHINDALAPNLTQSMAHCEVIFAVLQVVDQELYDVIMRRAPLYFFYRCNPIPIPIPPPHVYTPTQHSDNSDAAHPPPRFIPSSAVALALLRRSDSQPHFAIGWILTWFAHDLEDLKLISRIYDACIASHPLFPAYLA